MAKSNRASLIKRLKDKGIDFPSKATVSQLEHILKTRESGKGYVLRAIKPTSRGTGPAKGFPNNESVWVPSSSYARAIVDSKPHIVTVVGRLSEEQVPNTMRVMEIPEEWDGGHN
tara:strand:+ start:1491 stop:1835 length:345 start_codon:yes stop_codon:yes gene_type:complete